MQYCVDQTLLLNSESEFKRLSKEPQKIEDNSQYKPGLCSTTLVWLLLSYHVCCMCLVSVPKMRLAYKGEKKSERLQTFSSEFMLFNESEMFEEKAQDQPSDKG